MCVQLASRTTSQTISRVCARSATFLTRVLPRVPFCASGRTKLVRQQTRRNRNSQETFKSRSCRESFELHSAQVCACVRACICACSRVQSHHPHRSQLLKHRRTPLISSLASIIVSTSSRHTIKDFIFLETNVPPNSSISSSNS